MRKYLCCFLITQSLDCFDFCVLQSFNKDITTVTYEIE